MVRDELLINTEININISPFTDSCFALIVCMFYFCLIAERVLVPTTEVSIYM